MTLAELDAAVAYARREYPDWREGQAYFNVLFDLEPDCVNAMQNRGLDPFYDDRRLPDFRRFVAEWLGEDLP